nr:MAG TPA: DNA helicase [Caudoviricetes sp.]
MRIIVDNQIIIEEPNKAVVEAIKQDLIVKNPKWVQNGYLGFSRRNIPEYLYFYEQDGDKYIVPFGYLKRLYSIAKESEWVNKIHGSETYFMLNTINLYDYQEEVAKKVIKVKNGILVMPAGAGKTVTATKIACEIGYKTLWITHTIDLLNQAYDTAKRNGITGLGKITNGKVEIGSNITYATVQTLSKLDLTKYKDTWGTIIVDECHRVCGTPAAVTMFYKCISSLSARYKIGLTATPERSQKGTERAMFALLGEVIAEVPKDAVKKLHAKIQVVHTGYKLGEEAEKSDGTIDYTKATDLIGKDEDRNELIVDLLGQNKEHYCLILGDRVEHLKALQESLGIGAVIHGNTNKNVRENNLNDIRQGRIHYLFSSFALAKEGLDIPRLDRLFLVAPRDDKSVIVQSVGRIERCFDGKDQPVVYDFVDDGEYFNKKFKKRKTIYRKNGNELIE